MLLQNEDAFQRWRRAPAGRAAFRRMFDRVAGACQVCDPMVGVCDRHGREIDQRLRTEFHTKIAAGEHPAVSDTPSPSVPRTNRELEYGSQIEVLVAGRWEAAVVETTGDKAWARLCGTAVSTDLEPSRWRWPTKAPEYYPPDFQTLHDHLRDHLWWIESTKLAELEESIRAGIVALIAQSVVAATTHDPRAKHGAGVLAIKSTFARFLGLHHTYEFETRPPAAPAAGEEGGR